MAIDASIYRSQRPLQIEDPLTMAGKALSIQGMRQQQAGALALQEQQRQISEGEKLRQLFSENPDVRAALPKVYGINPTLGISMQKSLHDQEKAALDTEKLKIENNAKKAERFGAIAATIKDEPSFYRGISTALDEGLIGAPEAQALIQQGWNPQTQQQVDQIRAGSIGAKEQHDVALADLEDKRKSLAAQHEAELQPYKVRQAQAQAETTEAALPGVRADADIKAAGANALKQMTRSDWDAALDAVVTDKTSPLYQRTRAAVDLSLRRGDLKGAQDAIRRAGDQLGRTETAVATAKATAPIRIETANAEKNTAAAEITPNSKEFRVAQDLAYGKLTMSQFRSLYSYSRDVNKKTAIYDKAAELNPNFNPAAFEMGYTLAKNPKVQQQLASLDNVKQGVPDLGLRPPENVI